MLVLGAAAAAAVLLVGVVAVVSATGGGDKEPDLSNVAVGGGAPVLEATTSSQPTSSTTAAPVTTVAAVTTTTTQAAVTGPLPSADLKLSRPMATPPCTGQFVVFVGASVEPSRYGAEVQQLLDRHPGSSYVRTDQGCPSLRRTSDRGTAIYAVYLGPFGTKPEACATAASVGGGAYVKVLDTSTPAALQQPC